MLASIRTRFTCHLEASKNSFRYLRSKPLTALTTVSVIALTLTLPALFWVFTDNFQQFGGEWQHGGHISLYLDSSVPSDQSAILERVRSTPEVADASLRSSAEGLAELQQEEGMQDVMQYLPDNPLPAVIDVIPSANINTVEKSDELYQILKAYPHVEQAKFDRQWVNRFYLLSDIASKIAKGTMLLLALVVVIIVGSMLRTAIHNRQEETRVLAFIGANNSYIIRPFLYLGVVYGVAGAVLAMVLVQIMTLSLASLINQLAKTYEMHFVFSGMSFEQSSLLLVFAMTLGWIGARLSVSSMRRFSMQYL